jgi:hypothetical protein
VLVFIPSRRNVISIAPGFRLGFEIRFCFNRPIGAERGCPDGAVYIFSCLVPQSEAWGY